MDGIHLIFLLKCAGESAIWSSWSDWNECTQSCGGGFSSRQRTCRSGDCEGPDAETRRCNNQKCPGEKQNNRYHTH